MTQPTLSSALQRVAERFATRLEGRLDQLEAEAGALSARSAPEAFVNLERALHDIAGTAPTLGYSALGQAARNAEHHVGLVRLEDAPHSAERLALISVSVQALRESVGQATN